MVFASFVVLCGLALLLWSADKFVEASAATARYFRMPPLLIGMVIVGFGTSAPEMMVSGLASFNGSPGIALGNAYGSNITNIALILGLVSVIKPIEIHSQVVRRELPILIVVSIIAGIQLLDGHLSRVDAIVLISIFLCLMGWTIFQGMKSKVDPLGSEVEKELKTHSMEIKKALIWVGLGLLFLLISSRILVWGAIEIARFFEISDLIIGLTIVAVGTSLPELASSIVASRKGEHDIALGNVLGSNLFNTLAVVGLAGLIHPMATDPTILSRDILTMTILTVLLFIMGFGFYGQSRINRAEGALLLGSYVLYMGYLVTISF